MKERKKYTTKLKIKNVDTINKDLFQQLKK